MAKAQGRRGTGLHVPVLPVRALTPGTPHRSRPTRPPHRRGPPPSCPVARGPGPRCSTISFVGQTEYSSWAVTTSAGIILIDTIFDYSVEDGSLAGSSTGAGSGANQIRDREPRSRRPHQAAPSAAGPLQHADHSVGGGLGICSRPTPAPCRNPGTTWWPPTGRSSPSATPLTMYPHTVARSAQSRRSHP